MFYHNAAIGQNPFYSISDIPTNPDKAKGQVNKDAFNSYGTTVRHTAKINGVNGKWITGIIADVSPAAYYANHIEINKDNNGVYYNYALHDSSLTNYNVDLINTGAYTQLEFTPAKNFKVVAAARYDRLDYKFDNRLSPGAYTGVPDAANHFDHFTPNVGLTYNTSKNIGIYANCSVGFAPPNITDLYTGVQVPTLKPSNYNNHEVGGWLAFAQSKGYN